MFQFLIVVDSALAVRYGTRRSQARPLVVRLLVSLILAFLRVPSARQERVPGPESVLHGAAERADQRRVRVHKGRTGQSTVVARLASLRVLD
jgi:hypothetical protein